MKRYIAYEMTFLESVKLNLTKTSFFSIYIVSGNEMLILSLNFL